MKDLLRVVVILIVFFGGGVLLTLIGRRAYDNTNRWQYVLRALLWLGALGLMVLIAFMASLLGIFKD